MTASAIRSIAWRDGRLFAGETGGAEHDRADSPAHLAAVFPSLPGGYDAPIPRNPAKIPPELDRFPWLPDSQAEIRRAWADDDSLRGWLAVHGERDGADEAQNFRAKPAPSTWVGPLAVQDLGLDDADHAADEAFGLVAGFHRATVWRCGPWWGADFGGEGNLPDAGRLLYRVGSMLPEDAWADRIRIRTATWVGGIPR